ncbi:MAG: hypothetical protein HN742_02575 [Lentisphaerae bacterium]|jgi:hypothetical protein|nr:hypothetical protein [Lentisphaerota bacterium]MBT4819677.1 hypothetical protein [Lentisphaerota bacterium]MBT5608039.1 hypothetical protein [Lentisphaerota bacterium]MBT7056493.1 hypothetical protein [Lentisphaerota bacterium]MBT7840724.1 hypothetical protein [Lentisphaerota bacterium]
MNDVLNRLAGWAAVIALTAGADAVYECDHFRLTLGTNATVASLTTVPSGRECIVSPSIKPLVDIRIGAKTHRPSRLTTTATGFEVTFADVDTVLAYTVTSAPDWVVFRLDKIAGTRPGKMTLLRLQSAIAETVGRRLNIAYDDETALCLLAANRQPDCGVDGRKGVFLTATTQDAPGPKLEGSAVALIACPTGGFKAIARNASHAFGMLTNEDAAGAPVKDTDLVRGSYFFISLGEDDVDKAIDYCNAAGIRQVMISSGAWCRRVGHYVFNERNYPNGVAGLKGVVDRLHAEGIRVGMHTFVSKISKTDPYVSPVPDTRFWRKFETVLADSVNATQDTIRVQGSLRDWAGSSTTADKYWEGGVHKHRDVIIGMEIIQYEKTGPEGVWNTFEGCKRGGYGTKAAGHNAGEPAVHYGVDGCINGYIIDQETDLMEEVADRIADIFNTCGFDMVYFDGGEDVDRRRYRYYVSNFQEQAMKRFTKRPIVHMGTVMTHRLWHSFARSSTVDTYLNTLHGAIIGGKPPEKWPTVKEHINRSVRYMLRVRKSMMPGELGWFGIWAKKNNTDGLQLDEAEYLMCKSLGYDVPVSLQTSFASMESHILTPEILEIVRTYEELRLERSISAETSLKLCQMDRDYAMINHDGRREFVPMAELPTVGGTHDVRAFVGSIDGGSVATVWHYLRDGTIALDLPPGSLRLTTFAGKELTFGKQNGRPVIPVDSSRHTLLCRGVSVSELTKALDGASLAVRPPRRLFLRAADFSRLQGKMGKGSGLAVSEPDALSGDTLLCTGSSNYTKTNQWFAEYTVDIPAKGRWTIWGRVRYPTGTDCSFGFVPAGEEATLKGNQVFGNCGVNKKRWHWTGRGGGSTTVPPGAPIARVLEAGPFTFRIYAREASGSVALNPRLDVICLTDEPGSIPTDEEARKALAQP